MHACIGGGKGEGDIQMHPHTHGGGGRVGYRSADPKGQVMQILLMDGWTAFLGFK